MIVVWCFVNRAPGFYSLAVVTATSSWRQWTWSWVSSVLVCRRSLVRARARQMECRKKPVSNQPTNLLKLDFRYLCYYSAMYRRPSWDNARKDSYQWLPVLEAVTPHICVCLIHVKCFRFFLAANIVAAPNCRQRAQHASLSIIAKERPGF